MNNINSWLKGSLSLNALFRTLEYKRLFRKAHPEYFDPDGIIVFCGKQGAGKTLSLVQYVQKLCEKYPDVKVCSNMELTLPPGIELFPWEGVKSFTDISNGYAGVIYVIDEIHLEFNSLESKKMDSSVFTTVSQQRKQRKHIVGTSQVFSRIAKPFREQFKYAIDCRSYFGCFQINTLVDARNATEKDGEIVASSLRRFFWFHRPELYGSYDTYAVMKRLRKEWDNVSGN